MTGKDKSCGHCKHFQVDGMFGMWCEKKHNWTEVEYCEDYERQFKITKKRFELDSEIGFIDTQKDGEDTMTLFEVVVELNKLNGENEQLRELMKDLKHEYDSLHDTCAKLDKKVKCIQEEANDYCEELMGKDEFIRLYRMQRDKVIEDNNQLKMENNELKLLVQNWEALDEEKDEQLDKQNQALKKFYNKNEHIKKIIQNYNTNEYKHSSDALTDIINIIKE